MMLHAAVPYGKEKTPHRDRGQYLSRAQQIHLKNPPASLYLQLMPWGGWKHPSLQCRLFRLLDQGEGGWLPIAPAAVGHADRKTWSVKSTSTSILKTAGSTPLILSFSKLHFCAISLLGWIGMTVLQVFLNFYLGCKWVIQWLSIF